MTKEEFIGKMQMAYIGDKNALNECTQEYLRIREVINKAIELLGDYTHYSTPDEKQNGDNEDLVNNAFDILKEVD